MFELFLGVMCTISERKRLVVLGHDLCKQGKFCMPLNRLLLRNSDATTVKCSSMVVSICVYAVHVCVSY